MVCAPSMASAIERTVQSMFDTTPLRRPRQGTLPTPRIVMPSASTSPTTAETFVVPMSRPTTISVVSIRLFMRNPPLAGQDPALDRADAGMRRENWPNFGAQRARSRRVKRAGNAGNLAGRGGRDRGFGRGFARGSSHPHDHALGVRVVVQE